MPVRSKLKAAKAIAGAFTSKQTLGGVYRFLRANELVPEAECTCCGFSGKFLPAGHDARVGQCCPACGSYDRHRLIALAFATGFLDVTDANVIHFAAEPALGPLFRRQGPKAYLTADLQPGRGDLELNLEKLDLPDASQDIIVASHVLEHVDDKAALAEIFRVLKPGGRLVALVPIVEGWSETFEDPTKTSPEDRERYFGQFDHVRFYGADFRERVRAAGFELSEFTAGAEDSAKYRLLRGEKVFLATRPLI